VKGILHLDYYLSTFLFWISRQYAS